MPFSLPPAFQPPVGGPLPGDRVTAYAFSYGGSATAYAAASVPAAGPVTVQPEMPTAQRSWRRAAAVAAGLFVAAVGCGVLALAYPSLEHVWQVAGGFSTVAGTAAALVMLVGRRNGAGVRQ